VAVAEVGEGIQRAAHAGQSRTFAKAA
jgi:hypothetical protein